MCTREVKNFCEDQPKKTAFRSKTNKNSQNFSKNNSRRITSKKRSRIMKVLQRRLNKIMRKTLVFFVKFVKGLITMQKNVGTNASPIEIL